MSYDGLTDQLVSKDSFAARDRGFVDSTTYDTKYEVPTGGVNYTNLTRDSRPYDAVVSVSGELGTYKDIESAVAYINSIGKGKILIKKGDHIINKPIVLNGGVSLIGEGIINTNVILGTTTAYIETRGNEISISSFSLYGTPDNANTALYINGGDALNVNTLYLTNCLNNIILGSATQLCNFSDITIVSSGTSNSDFVVGLSTGTADNLLNTYNNINILMDGTTNNQVGFNISAGQYFKFNECFAYAGSIGYYIDNSNTDRSVFSNCLANSCFDGFKLQTCERVSFIGCNSNQNRNDGYNCIGVTDCTFSNSIIMDNTRYGINLGTGCTRPIILGNNFTFCGTAINDLSAGGTQGFNLI